MGCAVQLYKSTNRRGTWAKHSTNGWYLGTLKEHYPCHIIYVKKTRSEQISDTVFFKHRYTTQPTLTQADIIVKAIDDLTLALKGRKNTKGNIQIEALEKINELLNNIHTKIQAMKETRVTFDKATAPPREINARTVLPATKPKSIARLSVEKAIVDKPIPAHIPTPRVQEIVSTPGAQETASTLRVQDKLKEPMSPQRRQLHSKIHNTMINQTRLPHCHNMQL